MVIRNIFGDYIPLKWDLFYQGQVNSDSETEESDYDDTFELLHVDAGLYDSSYLEAFKTIHKFEDVNENFESFDFDIEVSETDFYKWLWKYTQHDELADVILSFYSGCSNKRCTVPHEDNDFVISILKKYLTHNNYDFDIELDEEEGFRKYSEINDISYNYESVYPVVHGMFKHLDKECIRKNYLSKLINAINADISEIYSDVVWDHVYLSSVRSAGYDDNRYLYALRCDEKAEFSLILADSDDDDYYYIQALARFISERFEVGVNELVNWEEKYNSLVSGIKNFITRKKSCIPFDNRSNKNIDMRDYITDFKDEQKIWNEVIESRKIIKESRSLKCFAFNGRKDYLTSQYHGYCQLCHERTPSGESNDYYFTYRILKPKRDNVDGIADLAANLFAVCPTCHGALNYGFMGFDMTSIFVKSQEYVKEFLDLKDSLDDAEKAPTVIESVLEDNIKPVTMKNNYIAKDSVQFDVTVNGESYEMIFSWDHFIRLAMILNEDLIYDD